MYDIQLILLPGEEQCDDGDILRAVNGAASLHSGNPVCCRSVSGLALPRSAGRVSTLARERPVALSRGHPSTDKSLPRGFSAGLSPRRSCLAAPVPAPVTPFDRARGAPSPWVVDGPTPVVTSHRESAEPVHELSARAILIVGAPVRQSPVVSGTESTRFTPVPRTLRVLVCERELRSRQRRERRGFSR